jgi:hypothetical protein
VLNAGDEIKAMKLLMLHCIASSLYRFIAPGAQPEEGIEISFKMKGIVIVFGLSKL